MPEVLTRSVDERLMDALEVIADDVPAGPLGPMQKEAFEVLFRDCRPKLAGFLYGKGFSPTELDDAVQATFMAAITHRGQRFENMSAFFGWLKRVAFNAAAQRYRGDQRQMKIARRNADAMHAGQRRSYEPDAVENLEEAEHEAKRKGAVRKMQGELRKLSGDQAALIRDICLKGIPQREVAKKLKIHEGNVTRRRQAIMKQLQERLLKRGIDPECLEAA